MHTLRNRVIFFGDTLAAGLLSLGLNRYMLENFIDDKGLLVAGNLPQTILWVVAIAFAAGLAVMLRTIGGDVCILARHMDYVAPLGMGMATVEANGKRRNAACIGGMLSVVNGNVTLVPTTFEWADAIDVDRATASEQRAKDILASKNATDTQLRLAEARLKRALVRKSVASFKN